MFALVLQDSDLEVVEVQVATDLDDLKGYISDPDRGEWFDYPEGFDLQGRLDQLDGVGPTIDFDGFYVTIREVEF